MEFKVGQKYDIYFGPGHFNNKMIEVRGIIDKYWVVYKVKGKGDDLDYRYVIEHIGLLEIFERDGILTKHLK